MKYCVLGAGLMGRAVAYDLLLQGDTKSIILIDNNIETLRAASLQKDPRLHTEILDISNERSKLEDILENVDAAIGAIHYKFNFFLTQIAIKTKTHFCDLGGNSSIVDEQLRLDVEAKKANISIIPDCGLAPGMVSVLVKYGLEKYNWVDTVKIRVGGLPQNPKNTLKYEKLFSIDGLINEYVEPVRVLKDGKIKVVEPLTEIEEIEFSNVETFHRTSLEAFTTSGGVSTLVETYKDKLKNLDYKTIRYKGHCSEIKKLQKEGLFTHEYFEENLPVCKKDVTLVKIIFEGNSKRHELVIVDYAKDGFTSMMRMTAFPASIISQMLARGQINEPGVKPQEKCVPVDLFIEELSERNIFVEGLVTKQKA
jgi:lysine 6-dehydrogenase